MRIKILHEAKGNRWTRWISWAKRNIPDKYKEFQSSTHLGLKAYHSLYDSVLEELRKRRPDLYKIEGNVNLEGFIIRPNSASNSVFYKDPESVIKFRKEVVEVEEEF